MEQLSGDPSLAIQAAATEFLHLSIGNQKILKFDGEDLSSPTPPRSLPPALVPIGSPGATAAAQLASSISRSPVAGLKPASPPSDSHPPPRQ